ncbi:Porphobilinogen deaminase [Balamuthia mandrillaris]
MEEERKKFVIGSRTSQLALIQTNMVKDMLEKDYPDLEFVIETRKTKGDKILNVALSQIGDTRLFTKELEDGMLSGEIDFAVHSLKDLPTELPEGLVIPAIFKRELPNDALILHQKHLANNLTLDTLPAGSVVGTSSLRRKAQILRSHPHLVFESVRGNLNTRLQKLDDGEYDALILAASGLERLGMKDRIHQILDASQCLHAVGQGALAVECRANDKHLIELLSRVQHAETAHMCLAERAFLRELHGGCQVPVGVHTCILEDGKTLRLKGAVLSVDGSKNIAGETEGDLAEAESLGTRLAKELKGRGASEILEDIFANVRNAQHSST